MDQIELYKWLISNLCIICELYRIKVLLIETSHKLSKEFFWKFLTKSLALPVLANSYSRISTISSFLDSLLRVRSRLNLRKFITFEYYFYNIRMLRKSRSHICFRYWSFWAGFDFTFNASFKCHLLSISFIFSPPFQSIIDLLLEWIHYAFSSVCVVRCFTVFTLVVVPFVILCRIQLIVSG